MQRSTGQKSLNPIGDAYSQSNALQRTHFRHELDKLGVNHVQRFRQTWKYHPNPYDVPTAILLAALIALEQTDWLKRVRMMLTKIPTND